ncbi:MAG: murein biosynthesis protein MurJ [Desulfitibacter sp. BRH_c19]|nr:MAG: murein biosynthesis protein MurJ [Desulfitibacter sp. BRH_c19]
MTQGNRVAKAAGIIMISMMISRILGYLRDVVIYAQFGQNRVTDAYNAAFSIPDFLYMILVGGALSAAFIPVFSSYLAEDKEQEAWQVASILFNSIMLLLIVGVTLGLIYTPFLIKILVPGFDKETTELTVMLTRIMFAQTFFMVLSGISIGILNSYQYFLAPAIGSVLYNLSIILVGWVLSLKYGIVGFSIGVVVGAMLNFAVQVPFILKKGFKYHFSFNLRNPGVQKIIILILPVFIGLSVNQINLFVNQFLASSLEGGLVAALRTGQRLMQMPIAVFAIAIGVAVFPTLTNYAAKGDMINFKRATSIGLRAVFFITLPSAAGLMALKLPLVRFLFEQGKFSSEATVATAAAVFFYSLGIFAYSGIQILNRTFYAIQDTKTPVTVGICTIIINIALNFGLIGPMGHGGLALAYSMAGGFNLFLLMLVLKYKITGYGGWRIVHSFGKSLIASIVMGISVYFGVNYFEFFVDISTKTMQGLQVMIGVLLGTCIYSIIAYIFKMDELELVLDILLKKIPSRIMKKHRKTSRK